MLRWGRDGHDKECAVVLERGYRLGVGLGMNLTDVQAVNADDEFTYCPWRKGSSILNTRRCVWCASVLRCSVCALLYSVTNGSFYPSAILKDMIEKLFWIHDRQSFTFPSHDTWFVAVHRVFYSSYLNCMQYFYAG